MVTVLLQFAHWLYLLPAAIGGRETAAWDAHIFSVDTDPTPIVLYTPDLSYFAPVSMEQANYRIRTPPKRNMRVKFPSLTQLLWTMMESFFKRGFLRGHLSNDCLEANFKKMLGTMANSLLCRWVESLSV